MLVNCAAYQEGKRIADLSSHEIGVYLQRPDCVVWVAMKDPTEEEIGELQRAFGLHDLAVEDARHGHQRPKIEEYGETLFAVLHLIELLDGEIVVGELDIFVGGNFVLSLRYNSQIPLLGVRERCEREPWLLKQGAGYIFYALMDAVVDRYFPVIDALESELEAVEERIFEQGQARVNIERLYELKRRIMVVKHAVEPLMEASGKLHSGRVPPVCIGSKDYFRDVNDHLVRIDTTLDRIRDTIATAIHVCLSGVAIEQNEVNKRLAAWAALFAVITAFAGIWGMNFKYMPELQWEYGYPLALLTMIGVCGVLYYRFKRSGWL
jgi:magnesium transporter